jgi:hypothetical protein
MTQRERLSREMMDLADHLADVLEQPDPRAWDHLLIYCPLDRLEAAYVRKSQMDEQGKET